MDIYDMQVSPPKEDVLDTVVENGHKVRITRMATYTYEVDMEDVYDILGETDITVRTLISEEEGEDGLRHNPGILRASVIEDDVVISVEVL